MSGRSVLTHVPLPPRPDLNATSGHWRYRYHRYYEQDGPNSETAKDQRALMLAQEKLKRMQAVENAASQAQSAVQRGTAATHTDDAGCAESFAGQVVWDNGKVRVASAADLMLSLFSMNALREFVSSPVRPISPRRSGPSLHAEVGTVSPEPVLHTVSPTRTFAGHESAALCMCFIPSGPDPTYVASGAMDGTTLVWKLEDGAVAASFHHKGKRGAHRLCLHT